MQSLDIKKISQKGYIKLRVNLEQFHDPDFNLYEEDSLLITPKKIINAMNFIQKDFAWDVNKINLNISTKDRNEFINKNKDNADDFTNSYFLSDLARPFFLKIPQLPSLQLKDYQNEGVSWLQEGNHRILADDMGLGKTLQSIYAAAKLLLKGELKYALIIAPNSLVTNWCFEFKKWFPSFCITQISDAGTGKARTLCWLDALQRSHFVVVSYDQLRNIPKNININFSLIIADEVHKLRKSSSSINRVVNSLNFDRFWGLSGTPIENNQADLINLICLIDKRADSSSLKLMSDVSLSGYASNYILRRMKKDVLSDLKDFDEKVIHLHLSEKQEISYFKALSNLHKFKSDEYLSFFNQLKQICDLDPVSGESCKIEYAMEMIEKVKLSNEKIVIFSFWLEPLRALKNELDKIYLNSCSQIYEGSLESSERDKLVYNFQNSDEPFVMLCSGKIASEGLTLTAANHVIFLNDWWNPSNNLQARDRVIRIGQTKKAFIYHLRTINTIESRLDEILKTKKEINSNVLDTLIKEFSKEKKHA